ncbi:MAG: glycosyltransferase family 4 protein [bacterium]|nr:glycosyltransferase family 4 protein [bacterium]
MANNLIRIAFIAPYFGIGGIERTFLTIAENLAQKGYVFYFINLGNALFQKRFKDAGECFYSPDYNEVIRFLKDKQIDIVQTACCDEGNYLAYLAGVSRIIERPDGLSTAFLTDKIPVDCVVASTESVFKKAQGMYPEKQVACIYNGVDLSVFAPQKKTSALQKKLGICKNDVIIGYCGRLAEPKCLERLIDVFCHLCDSHQSVKLLIVGDEFPTGNGYKKRLEEYVHALGIQKRVIFAGSYENPAEVINLFSIAVNCSGSYKLPDGTYETEGIPNAVMEAMAVGIPVVATDSGDTHLLVKNSCNGFLVDVQNWTQFAEKLMFLLGNPSIRHEMGIVSRQIVLQKFSKEKMLCAYEQLYRDVLSRDWSGRYPNTRKKIGNHFLSNQFSWEKLSQKRNKILVIRSGNESLFEWTVKKIQRTIVEGELHVLCHEKHYNDVSSYSGIASILSYSSSALFNPDLMRDTIEELKIMSFEFVFVLFNDLLGRGYEQVIELSRRSRISSIIVVNSLRKAYCYSLDNTLC